MPRLFTLDDASLRRIFEAWSVPVPKSGYVLFGLRGALPRRVGTGWSRAAELEAAPVDHLHMRCTLGIWDPARRRLFAAPGSTVPHRENVDKAALRGGRGANQLEPGCYADLTKGEHLQGKPNGHQALRQTANRFYRRAPGGLPYSARSPLYYGNPYDNLHCGWNMETAVPGFRSAGCLVVAGTPRCPRHEKPQPDRGPWKAFHDLLYAARQRSFPILLLPAGDVMELLAEKPGAAGGKPAARLVFGSRGEAVKRLQGKLAALGFYKGRPDGDLGPRTYRAWNASGFKPA